GGRPRRRPARGISREGAAGLQIGRPGRRGHGGDGRYRLPSQRGRDRGARALSRAFVSGEGHFLPAPGGAGRLALSVAKCETGWGDGLSTRALLDVERLSPHLAARFARVDPPPPGED